MKEKKVMDDFIVPKEDDDFPLSKDSTTTLKKIKEEKIIPSCWTGKPTEIEQASEFGIPVLAEIESKLETAGSSYRDIFLDIENVNLESNPLNKDKKKSEPNAPEESAKDMLKLVPKQVLSRHSTEPPKIPNRSPEQYKKKVIDLESHKLPKPVEVTRTEDVHHSSHRIASPKSPKRKSPSRKDRDSENRDKSSAKNAEKEVKDKKEYQSRSSRRSSPPMSSTAWDLKEPVKIARNASPSRSRSRSRSRSPRRRDDRSKNKRDKRSPAKQTYRGKYKNLSV